MKMQKYKHIFQRLVLGVVMTILLASCGRGSADLCVYADDFGDIAESRKSVYSYQNDGTGTDGWPAAPATGATPESEGWVYSDIELVAGTNMNIRSAGSVDLCVMSEAQVLTTYPWTYIDPRVNGWQDFSPSGSPVSLQTRDEITIEVRGSFSRYSDGSYPLTGGASLFAYIGEDPNAPPAGFNWDTHRSYGGTHPQYFEMNQSGIPTSTQAAVPATGIVRFRISDNGSFWGNPGHYGDNQGGYEVQLKVWRWVPRNCQGDNGAFMIARIGDDPRTSSTEINLHDCTVGHTSCSGNSSGVYNATAPADGKLWFKIIDLATVDWNRDTVADNRGDGITTKATFNTNNPPTATTNGNVGRYIVETVAVQRISGGLSNVINVVIDPLKDTLMGSLNTTTGVRSGGLTERMYNGITGNGDYIDAVRAAMALAIAIFAFSYMAGLSKITQRELLTLTFRLAFIITLISPGSWEFFRKYLFFFFLEGTEELIWIMSSQFTTALTGVVSGGTVDASGAIISTTTASSVAAGSTDTFEFLNQTLARFFTKETNSKIAGVLNSWPLGIVYAIMIYVGMFYFLFAVGKAMILYMISIIMVALLLFLAPIFIPFMLFERTRSMFDGWIKQLMSFSLQPILLFMLLSIFNVFIYSVFVALLSFTVCWSCVAELDLPLNDLLGISENFDKFCLAENYKGWGAADGQGLGTKLTNSPVGLFMILIYLIMVNAMMKFTDWIVSVSQSLTAGSSGVNLGTAAKATIQQTAATIATVTQGTVGTAKLAGGVVKGTGKFLARKALDIEAKKEVSKQLGGDGGDPDPEDKKGVGRK